MFEMPSGGFLLIDRFSRNEGMPLSDEGDSIEPQRSLPTIIVVDDERRIADTLTEILEMSGFRVATA
jgi:PleD family two-component response regulator